MKAPIRYFGGKGNLANKILEHFPDKYDVYIEPFGGAYSVGFSNRDIPKVEIYNDLEKNVFTLFNVLSTPEKFKLFKEKCDILYYDQNLWQDFKNRLKDDILIDIERAFYFYAVNRMSYSGVGGFSVNKVIRRNMSKSISDLMGSIDRLPEIHQRLSRVLVTNMDGIDLIRRYDDNMTFIYCDPPYEQGTRGNNRYVVDMDETKQKEFIETCVRSKSKLLISGYDNQFYTKLEEYNFKKIEMDVLTLDNMNKTRAITECLWLNY